MASLKLHEVLEEEYVAMYGPLAGEKVPETDEARLSNVIDAIHKKERTALCISGGGIRSATFALGIIQGLARAGLLKKFDYLSTVSGGGYIGSWLSSWTRRDRDGIEGVEKALANADTAAIDQPGDPNMVRRDVDKPQRELPATKIDPEPGPLRHLRAYSNYMSPKLGILSGDSWTLVAIYARNLLLNLLVLVPLLAAALALPRLFSWLLEGSRGLPLMLYPWAFAFFASMGFAYLGNNRPVEYGMDEEEKKTIKNPDIRFLTACVLPLTLAAIALAITWAREQTHGYDTGSIWFWAAAGASLFGMTILPYHLYYRRLKRATVAARRAGFINEQAFRGYLREKRWLELRALFVSMGTTAVLIYLLAMKVFDDPLRTTPQLAKLAPVLRFFFPSSPQAQLYVCFVVPFVLLVFFVQASIFVGLSSKRNQDADREWWARAGAWLVFAAVALAVINVISVFGPVGLYYAPVLLASVGGVAGIAAAMLGFSDKTPANQKEKEEGGAVAKAGNLASALIVPLFVVFLLSAISLGSTWLIHKLDTGEVAGLWKLPASMQSEFTRTVKVEADANAYEMKETLAAPRTSMPALRAAAHLATIQNTTLPQLLVFLAAALIAVGLSFRIGVNKFSMNALYRNRLIRAYLGASRWRRDPDAFTGFDEDDNLPMWTLRPDLLWTTSILDLDGCITALKKTEQLWELLDEKTRDLFANQPYDAQAKEMLVVNLNHLLMTEDFSRFHKVPAWAASQPSEIRGYSEPFRNRAILDEVCGAAMRAMPVPDSAKRELPKGAVSDKRAPMHVVNIALNLTSGDNLAWQQRMAESFTVSPLHTGCARDRIGYRNSREYGGTTGISLGTAVSISGAAASPNMGYHSSPVMAFLLTFFNIRLGAWLGNPRDDNAYKESHPTTNLIPFAKEATGSSDDESKWIYLSDGGHFENLALYEMVLRRCRSIVLSDGGCDPQFTFEDLGNAIRKIRVDLGIPIEVYDIDMQPRRKNGSFRKGRFFARARIRYSAIDGDGAPDGTLIYIKAGVYDNEDLPRDIYNYAKESLLFPHEPTSDQFFSESQFESYRALGRYAVSEVLTEEWSAGARIPIAKKMETIAQLADCADKAARRRQQTEA